MHLKNLCESKLKTNLFQPCIAKVLIEKALLPNQMSQLHHILFTLIHPLTNAILSHNSRLKILNFSIPTQRDIVHTF